MLLLECRSHVSMSVCVIHKIVDMQTSAHSTHTSLHPGPHSCLALVHMCKWLNVLRVVKATQF